jgi:hypothetical protein
MGVSHLKVKCKECGREYTLKDDENPKDYTCECGGNLEKDEDLSVLKCSIYLAFMWLVAATNGGIQNLGDIELTLIELILFILPAIIISAIILREKNPKELLAIEGILFLILGIIVIHDPKSLIYGAFGILGLLAGAVLTIEGVLGTIKGDSDKEGPREVEGGFHVLHATAILLGSYIALLLINPTASESEGIMALTIMFLVPILTALSIIYRKDNPKPLRSVQLITAMIILFVLII